MSDASNGKVLVFAHHVNVLDGLADFCTDNFHGFIRIDGGTPGEERQNLVQRFQRDPRIRVAVLAITAAGVALTLTAASTVYFAEMFWTPGSLLQAEDRAHRIGQLNTVKIKYFLASNTVDEMLWPLVREKMKTLGEICEGRIVEAFKAHNVTEGGKDWDGASAQANSSSSPSSSPSDGARDFDHHIYGGDESRSELFIEDTLVQDIAQRGLNPITGASAPKHKEDIDEEEEEEDEGDKEDAGTSGIVRDDAAETDEDEEVEPDQLAVMYLQFRPHLHKKKFRYQEKSPYDPNKTKNALTGMQSGFEGKAGGVGLAGRDENNYERGVVILLDSEGEGEGEGGGRASKDRAEDEEEEARAFVDCALDEIGQDAGAADATSETATATSTTRTVTRENEKLISLLDSDNDAERGKEEEEQPAMQHLRDTSAQSSPTPTPTPDPQAHAQRIEESCVFDSTRVVCDVDSDALSAGSDTSINMLHSRRVAGIAPSPPSQSFSQGTPP